MLIHSAERKVRIHLPPAPSLVRNTGFNTVAVAQKMAGGTMSSNPASSSGESRANQTSSKQGCAKHPAPPPPVPCEKERKGAASFSSNRPRLPFPLSISSAEKSCQAREPCYRRSRTPRGRLGEIDDDVA